MKASRFLCVIMLGPAAAAVGCASQQAEPESPSYESLKNREIESERQEFIQEKREEIFEVRAKIESLQLKIDEQSASVDERQRAEWRNVLFELEQERFHLDSELDRAERVNDQEWEVMRGDIPVAVDSLQAGVTKLGIEVTNLFSPEANQLSADSGLCPVRVQDVAVDTEVDTKGESVVVEVTTADAKAVDVVRQRANTFSHLTTYQPGRVLVTSSDVPNSRGSAASGQRGSASMNPQSEMATPSDTQRSDSVTRDEKDAVAKEPIPLRKVSVENIEKGVRITFLVASERKDALREEVAQDAKRLESGDCAEAVQRAPVSELPPTGAQ